MVDTRLRLPWASSDRRADRLLSVLRVVNDRGAVALTDLAGELAVSGATLRRDVARLEDQGLLVRTRGGVRPAPEPGELPVHLRDVQAREAKRRIAARAAELIPAGPCTVAVSGGSTTAGVVRALGRRTRLTVVTNALPIALEAAANPAARVVLAGGTIRPASLEAVGPLAERTFAAIGIRMAVVGVAGLTAADGATTLEEAEARTDRAMVDHAARVMVVADGSKIGRVARSPIADASRLDVLVTDASADPDELQRLRRARVAVHVVEPRR